MGKIMMVESEFCRDCLGHCWIKVMPNVVVYVHFFPSFPVIDVRLFVDGDSWFSVFDDKWEIYRDYDFALWWNFGVDSCFRLGSDCSRSEK
jgi:hypothetical protein